MRDLDIAVALELLDYLAFSFLSFILCTLFIAAGRIN